MARKPGNRCRSLNVVVGEAKKVAAWCSSVRLIKSAMWDDGETRCMDWNP